MDIKPNTYRPPAPRLDLVRANKQDARARKAQLKKESEESMKRILEAYRVRTNQTRRS